MEAELVVVDLLEAELGVGRVHAPVMAQVGDRPFERMAQDGHRREVAPQKLGRAEREVARDRPGSRHAARPQTEQQVIDRDHARDLVAIRVECG